MPGYTPGGMAAGPHGVVFHIMGASLAAADGWFHNPSSRVSAHFGIGQDGTLVQWVDTADKAWHAAAANLHWFGVETEGSSGPLSEAGCATFGRLYRWLTDTQGAAQGITNDPNGGVGFGWHGMGGAAWGGHDYCPGPERVAQRQHILDLAAGTPAPSPHPLPEEDVLQLVILSTPSGQSLWNLPANKVIGIPDPFDSAHLTGVPVWTVDEAFVQAVRSS